MFQFFHFPSFRPKTLKKGKPLLPRSKDKAKNGSGPTALRHERVVWSIRCSRNNPQPLPSSHFFSRCSQPPSPLTPPEIFHYLGSRCSSDEAHLQFPQPQAAARITASPRHLFVPDLCRPVYRCGKKSQGTTFLILSVIFRATLPKVFLEDLLPAMQLLPPCDANQLGPSLHKAGSRYESSAFVEGADHLDGRPETVCSTVTPQIVRVALPCLHGAWPAPFWLAVIP